MSQRHTVGPESLHCFPDCSVHTGRGLLELATLGHHVLLTEHQCNCLLARFLGLTKQATRLNKRFGEPTDGSRSAPAETLYLTAVLALLQGSSTLLDFRLRPSLRVLRFTFSAALHE